MRRKLIFGILILAISSCMREEIQELNNKQQTVVSGILKNISDYPNTKILHLQKNGQVNQARRDVKLESQIDGKGNFTFDFQLDVKSDFYLKPFEHIYLYLEPGDKLFVEIDLSEQNGMIFSGDRVKENEVLNLYYRKYYFDDRRREDRSLLSTLTPQQYFDYRDSIVYQNTDALEAFSKEHKLQIHLKEMLLSEILNRKYIKLLEYGILNSTNGRFDDLKNRTYYTSINQRLKEDILLMKKHSSFSIFLENYGYYFHSVYKSFDQFEMLEDSNIAAFFIRQILENEKDKSIREVLLYREAKSMLESYEIDEFEMQKELLYSNIKSELWLSEIQTQYEKLSQQGIDITPLSNYSLEDDGILKSIKSSYAGEVALINVWSPSCYPSIRDMKKTKDFLDLKNSSEGIKYINICTGKDEEKCKKLIQENNFPGDHIYLKNSNKIRSRFNSISLPLQIIIDKHGNVVRKGSNHRPYSPTTQKVFKKLQEEIKG